VGQTMAVGSELIRIEVDAAHEARAVEAERKSATVAPSTAPVPRPAPPPVRAPAPAMTVPKPAPAAAPRAMDRPIASPAVRRRAWELGVDLSEVVPSGTAGRIMHADLEAHAAAHPARPRIESRTAPSSGVKREGEEAVAIVGLRRKIALKMQESKRRI